MPLIRLIHWHEAEARERAARLSASGFTTTWRVLPGPELLAELKTTRAAAIVIDLSRLPSHGRDAAIHLRRMKATRHLPIVFVGGEAGKIARMKAVLPDAVCTTWEHVAETIREAIARPPADPAVPASVFAPYAGRSLVDKLGIKPGAKLALLHAPPGLLDSLGPLPEGVRTSSRLGRAPDLVMWFLRSRKDLKGDIARVAASIGDTPMWMAWPKKASGLETDLGEAVVRATGLEAGLVDYKICAIDATWSGLLFKRRKPVKGAKLFERGGPRT